MDLRFDEHIDTNTPYKYENTHTHTHTAIQYRITELSSYRVSTTFPSLFCPLKRGPKSNTCRKRKCNGEKEKKRKRPRVTEKEREKGKKEKARVARQFCPVYSLMGTQKGLLFLLSLFLHFLYVLILSSFFF